MFFKKKDGSLYDPCNKMEKTDRFMIRVIKRRPLSADARIDAEKYLCGQSCYDRLHSRCVLFFIQTNTAIKAALITHADTMKTDTPVTPVCTIF